MCFNFSGVYNVFHLLCGMCVINDEVRLCDVCVHYAVCVCVCAHICITFVAVFPRQCRLSPQAHTCYLASSVPIYGMYCFVLLCVVLCCVS